MLLVSITPLWTQGQEIDPVNFTAGTICGGDSSVEIISGDDGYVISSSISPPPSTQIPLNQAGMEPVPEPSTLAFGGLALGVLLSTATMRQTVRDTPKETEMSRTG